MPLYEYQCDGCGKRFEVIRKFSDPELDTCTQCGKGPVHRLQSSPAIQFKGTGWYITDYAQKGKEGGSQKGKEDGDSSAKGKEGGESSASSKSDTKKTDAGSTDAPASKADGTTASAPPKPSSSDT